MKKQKNKTKVEEPIEDKSILSKVQKDNLLLDLYSSKEWEALKMLSDDGIIQAERSLFSLDPFKNPTETARAQGIRIGLYSFETYILSVIAERKDKEAKLDDGEEKDDSEPMY